MAEPNVTYSLVDRYTKIKNSKHTIFNSYYEAIGMIREKYLDLENGILSVEKLDIQSIYNKSLDLSALTLALAVLIDRITTETKEEKIPAK